jgi:pyrroline-5-carboxylate reductase
VDLVERIVSHLRTWPGATKTNIRDEVTGKTGTTLSAVSWLKENGAITATGTRLNLNEVRLAELGY